MNDGNHVDEYIRKAVELADGWAWTEYDDHELTMLDIAGNALVDGDFACEPHEMPELLVDALAAQLVRQVDALDVELVSGKGSVLIEKDDPETEPFGIQNLAWKEGPDRIMNIIKAIVDSGLLKCVSTLEADK